MNVYVYLFKNWNWDRSSHIFLFSAFKKFIYLYHEHSFYATKAVWIAFQRQQAATEGF